MKPADRKAPALRWQKGLTLIEIMVAVALSVILLTGVIQIFVGTKATYRLQDNVARLQENGRFSLDFLTRDVRMAGYRGCTNFGTVTNTLNNGNSLAYDFTTGLTGFDNVGTSPPVLLSAAGIIPEPGTDVIIIRRNSNDPLRVTRNNNSAQLFTEVTSQEAGGCSDGTNKTSGLCQGDILMISDCVKSRVFQAGNIVVASGDANITHPASGAPGNTISSWGGASAPKEEQFNEDAEVVRIGTYAYFVSVRADGVPVLNRFDGTNVFELVEGVEDMQITYGEDTDGDRTADLYRDANTVVDWSQVVSARIHILVRTNDNNVTDAPADYTFNGVSVAGASLPATDRFLRREFIATVTIRNRAS